MKHVPSVIKNTAYMTFLTHTVQMKLGSESHYKPSYIMLLNPHGSDETKPEDKLLVIQLFFLTHTVQMKQAK